MFEDETSLTTEAEEEEDLFDFDEADFEPEEGEDAEEQESEEGKPSEDTDAFLTVKYNKAERKLSREEAIELAQKGLNYDKVFGEAERLRGAVKPYADQAEMTINEYLDHLAKTAGENAEATMEQQVRADYPYIADEAVKELVQARLKDQQAKTENAQQDAEKAKWAEAMSTYPDLQADKIPQDVLDAVNAGKDPLTAMHEHRIAALQEQLAKANAKADAAEKNFKNRAASTGSMIGRGNGMESDPFLSVWDSD